MTDLRMYTFEKELWLAALDSGQFPQATGHLYDGKGYCCLGVLAKAKGATFAKGEHEEYDDGKVVMVEDDDYHAMLDSHDIDDNELLAEDWARVVCGLSYEHMLLLAHLNDGTQWTLSPNHVMVELSRKLGSEEPAQSVVGYSTFKFKQHSFAEIAAVIREHF